MNSIEVSNIHLLIAISRRGVCVCVFFKPLSSLKSFSSVISGPLSPVTDTPMSENQISISSSF